jgi:hypothetical protein
VIIQIRPGNIGLENIYINESTFGIEIYQHIEIYVIIEIL